MIRNFSLPLWMNASPCFIDIVFDRFRISFHISLEREEAVKDDVFIGTVKGADKYWDIGSIGHMQKASFIFFDFGASAFGRKSDADLICCFNEIRELLHDNYAIISSVNGKAANLA